GILGVLLAPTVKCPAEVCLCPALLPIIPGMYAYRAVAATISCLSAADEPDFNKYLYLLNYNGMTCVFVIIGMVVAVNLPVFMMKKISFQATR
ncbi:MAG: threonine/serine exporter family protein, partial [Muribaculaceae bacterium]|nr:threonine/serine exporter family protein [Muribaculaceae bacterium]